MSYTVLFIFIYSMAVLFMMWFYTDATTTDEFFGRYLEINYTEEITFLICLAVLGIGFLYLEKFIKLYAITLVEHTRHIKRLQIEKEQLAREVLRYKDGSQYIDLDAPVQQAVKILNEFEGKLGTYTK
jgi:hypothetical protein